MTFSVFSFIASLYAVSTWTMTGKVTLAWALPVNTQALGVSLEAYVKSKPSLSFFKLCLKYGQSARAPIGKLPRELIELVAKYVYDPFLDDATRRWAKYQRCPESECRPLDHCDDPDSLPESFDIRFCVCGKCPRGYGSSCSNQEYYILLGDLFDDVHNERVNEHLESFNGSPPTTSLARSYEKYKKVSDMRVLLGLP